jgi:RNA polymerase sigma factor (TIGR02999 family)
MPEDQPGQVTELLLHWKQGDEKALRALVPLVYKELRRLAHYHLQSERPDHTLQSTALVHEAYLRLLGGQPIELKNRAHFIAVASRLMRQILVDYARSRRANKRDGGAGSPSRIWRHCPSPQIQSSWLWTMRWTSCLASTSARERS